MSLAGGWYVSSLQWLPGCQTGREGLIIKGEGHWLPGRITGQYWLFQILPQSGWRSLSADGLKAGYG